MRTNTTKRLAREGTAPAIGTLCTSASPLIAESLGYSGFDFILVDMQHGETNLDGLQPMLHALSSTPATPVVRVPGNVSMYIQRVLDLGAYGVIVPQVNTREEAVEVAANVRYAPQGHRSWGPVRGSLYGGSDYFANAAAELMTLVMLESAEAVANARDILAVDGIDGCFVGPADLGITLGHSPDTLPNVHPEVDAAIARIAEAAKATGKIAGIHAFSIDDARKRIAQGYRLMTVIGDTRMIRTGAAEVLDALRR
jgi:4-hydroxy-2-oxoheptanedioate aldolase